MAALQRVTMFWNFDNVPDRRCTKSLKWTRHQPDVLPLWVADMDFPAPDPVREVLRAGIDHGVFGYELPSSELARSVTDRMERLYGWRVAPESVLAIPGIVAGFKAAARAVCQPGQGILVQPPVYHPFLETPEHTSTVRQEAPLSRVPGNSLLQYAVDWDAFASSIHSHGTDTGMFLLCHPHNPTGQVWSRADLEKMGEICLRHKVVICSDEIHSELLLGGAQHVPLATIAPELEQQTITLFSPSKTFNLVGLFCGFAIIPNPTVRRKYRQVLQQSALHVNSLGLRAAEVALSGACDDWLRALKQYLTHNRDYLLDFISHELPDVRVTRPEATYLAWLDFGHWVKSGKVSPDPHRFLLEQAKVALNAGAEFGLGGESCARLNFGCPRALLAEALRRMKQALL